MAKTRLNQTNRQTLIEFAVDNIKVPQTKGREAAYKKAAQMVREDFDRTYPPQDMDTLRAYKAAHLDHCVRGVCSEGGFIGFEFFGQRNPKTGSYEYDELTPYAPRRSYGSRPIKFRKATVAAVKDYGAKKEAEEKAFEEKKKNVS